MWLSFVFCRVFACIMPSEHLELIDDIKYEEQVLETSFETNVRVEAIFSYPQLSETSFFECYVNETIKRDSLALYDSYIQKMGGLQEDAGDEEELNERTLHLHKCDVDRQLVFEKAFNLAQTDRRVVAAALRHRFPYIAAQETGRCAGSGRRIPAGCKPGYSESTYGTSRHPGRHWRVPPVRRAA